MRSIYDQCMSIFPKMAVNIFVDTLNKDNILTLSLDILTQNLVI